MASDIELFARLAADIVKENKANNTIPPEALDAEKAGENSEPDETETPTENGTEPDETETPTENGTEPPETPATPAKPATPATPETT